MGNTATKTVDVDAWVAVCTVIVTGALLVGFTTLLISITDENEAFQAERNAAHYEIDCSTGPHIYAQTIEEGEKGIDVITTDGRKVFIPWTNVGSIEKR